MAAALDAAGGPRSGAPGSPYDPAALNAASEYEDELRVSREELLRKISDSSRDIAGRCKATMEASQSDTQHAALFDDEERERVVEAYAAKLKASREEMIKKITDQQAVERTKCLEELKKDVQDVLEDVVNGVRHDFQQQRQREDAEDAAKRDAHAKDVLEAHARDLQTFNEQQLDGLRESMAKHRDDAMRRYQQEMAQFRDEQLAEISKLTMGGFADEDTEDEDLADWTDVARRAREHAGLPPDPGAPSPLRE